MLPLLRVLRGVLNSHLLLPFAGYHVHGRHGGDSSHDTMSAPPPGANDTMMRIGRVGLAACPATSVGRSSTLAPHAARAPITARRVLTRRSSRASRSLPG